MKSFLERTIILYFFLTTLFFLFNCLACNNAQKEPQNILTKDYKDPLLKANQHMVKVENEDINNYIRRHEWVMQTTATGLRYMIYKNGKGEKVNVGDKVKIDFKVNLITGIECYSSADNGPLEFFTGKAEVINGLEEAVLLMSEGDKAKVIIPSHLAYGLLGDEEKIPKRATLIYDIELIKVF